MNTVVQELSNLIEEFAPRLGALGPDEFSHKPLPHKWSKKEIVGHLIDSAHNNLRRFVVSQYEAVPPKITYDQDFWVNSNGYQRMEPEAVITLWVLLNRQIMTVLIQLSPEHYARVCDTGKEQQLLHSLPWLAEDYVKHMKHHLNQIFPGAFAINYK